MPPSRDLKSRVRGLKCSSAAAACLPSIDEALHAKTSATKNIHKIIKINKAQDEYGEGRWQRHLRPRERGKEPSAGSKQDRETCKKLQGGLLHKVKTQESVLPQRKPGTCQEGTVQGRFPRSVLTPCHQAGSGYRSRCSGSSSPYASPPRKIPLPCFAFLGSPEILVILERVVIRGTAESRVEGGERIFWGRGSE